MSCSVCAGHDTYNCPCCGETIQMIICPDCYGTGMKKPRAFHIYRRLTVEVTETTWQILPKIWLTKSTASRFKGGFYVQKSISSYISVCYAFGGFWL